MAAAKWPRSVLEHVIDAHCHPTEARAVSAESMERLEITVCAMSTYHGDQSLVRDLALQNPVKVIPCFGYHPWFSHLISLGTVTSKYEHYRHLFIGDDAEPSAEKVSAFEELISLLPEPMSIDEVLEDLRHNFGLLSSTKTMLGEVGLDKDFRVAFDYRASPRRLTPFTIPLKHQLLVLEAQLDLAVELRRSVSLHSVHCPQVTVDLLNKQKSKHGQQWEIIRIDLHSCSMNPQVCAALQKKHKNIFMSLSTTINGRSSNLNALIAGCPSDRLLIESDYNHIDACTEKCIEILTLVARVKGWPIEDEWLDKLDDGEWGVVRRLEANWRAFING
ncbi:TatD DNase family Scn1 [Mycena metata]|uniref:TatD DNase family Scn1 n=1 Tax=Mycena metata TaxID=1033252 RepID=A0AAD7KJW6_9AGAR|nr:TatD DNase family Scn1 [Mycena metata]